MASPSFLIEAGAPIVLDTSAIINLNATGRANLIFEALKCPVAVTDVHMRELETGQRNGRGDFQAVARHIEAGLITLVHLDASSALHFESLVVGPAAETLDDGEAATIAYSMMMGAIAVLDERKAIGICDARFPSLRVAATLDLIAQPAVTASMHPDQLRLAVLNALKIARMNVPVRFEAWVMELIGSEDAKQCPSLRRRLRNIA